MYENEIRRTVYVKNDLIFYTNFSKVVIFTGVAVPRQRAEADNDFIHQININLVQKLGPLNLITLFKVVMYSIPSVYYLIKQKTRENF